ncbi:MAG TPA: ClpXP protease specificity-enhancing factor SspB [Myxococcaceae bacterium]|nr:ClpXP protease specificity-enhancing factor SspB [Myxococcaceae bacterium]
MDDRTPEKKDRLLSALDRGMVMIHLDARRPGVVVPPALRGEAHLRLNLSYRFEPSDLSVGEWGLRSTLSFSGTRFTVAVPWSAVFAITSHASREFWMFPEDMPPELTRSTSTPPPRAVPDRSAARLRGVPRDAAAGDEGDGSPPRSRGHLRVVK